MVYLLDRIVRLVVPVQAEKFGAILNEYLVDEMGSQFFSIFVVFVVLVVGFRVLNMQLSDTCVLE